MIMEEYFKQDPRQFFSPLLDYSISEYLGKGEKRLGDLGLEYFYLEGMKRVLVSDLKGEAREIAIKIGIEPEVEFPAELFDSLKRSEKGIILGFKDENIPRILDELGFVHEDLDLHKLVSKTEAGLIPVVHSHLLFHGCPHPFLDKPVFEKVESLGGFRAFPDEVDRIFQDFSVRFEDVFSGWSRLVLDLRDMSVELERSIESESGARKLYAISQILGTDLDLTRVWRNLQFLISLPGRPYLWVWIFKR